MTVKNDTREFKPRRRGPGGHGPMGAMMGGEKAKDFKGSFQKLLAYIGRYVYLCAGLHYERHYPENLLPHEKGDF